MAIVQVVIMLVNESVNAKKGSAVTISGGSLYAYMRRVKLRFLD